MGNILKVGETYYIEFYARGLMYSQIAGPDLKTAQQLLNDTESKIAKGEALTVERYIDLPVFFDRFRRQITEDHSPKTIDRFQQLINHFSCFVKDHFVGIGRLSEVTPRVCEAYKDFLSKNYKADLVNFSVLLLREVMDYGIKIGFLNDNPTVHIKLLPWSLNSFKETSRSRCIKALLVKNISLGKICKVSGLPDIARLLYYRNLIPISREDMYN